MKIERAEALVTLPSAAKDWNADQAQTWARMEVLAGGPPDKPVDPTTGETIDWTRLRSYAGKRVKIRAKPMGLIFTMPDGSRKYRAGDATPSHGKEGFGLGTGTKEMRERAMKEQVVRRFSQDLISHYNKGSTKRIREVEKRSASREFWECGRRIRDFLGHEKGVTQDDVWYSLEQWGRGADGYGKNWLEYATYFYDWLPKPSISDEPVFALPETRIMGIIRASKNLEERRNLVSASTTYGPDITDDLFKWMMGQSKGNFPGTDAQWTDLQAFGRGLRANGTFDPSQETSWKQFPKRASKKKLEDDLVETS